MKILITAVPMLAMINKFKPLFEAKKLQIHCPSVIQVLSEEEIKSMVPEYDAWIVGDDVISREILELGKAGNIKAIVKWGIGVDNIDLEVADKLGIPVKNTPKMFGAEVADLAMSYITALARDTFYIDREVRIGGWPKPCGVSLAAKTLAVLGYGDIGKNLATRALAAEMLVSIYDPYDQSELPPGAQKRLWPMHIENADFIVLTCPLTPETKHILNADVFRKTKKGLRLVNVSRGELIDDGALIDALGSGQLSSVALDVFEEEPLPKNSPFLKFDKCILGSHNASNTKEAVIRTSICAIQELFSLLKIG